MDLLNKLDYCSAVINESHRSGSGSFKTFQRCALNDIQIGDLKIKKGTMIGTDFAPNHYCSKYHEKPFEYMPERWLDENSLTRQTTKQNPHIFIPFSSGPRNCIG
mmetsp:Transcript_1650/g.1478  ORF Transcript_1650/g.1478 Transcript_1650/m.1478 type:complete len:105 (-) Transcript_1650:234-548(-)